MTSPTENVRRAAESDIERLDDVYPEPGRPSSRHRDRWDLQGRGDGVYLVAWERDHPVGWVFVHRPGSSEASVHARHLDVAEVMDLSVSPGFRGRGHGTSLLASAERWARDAGWQTIGLEVTVANPHNDVARAMYERNGYRDAGLGEFESGYFYWTVTGERLWEGEPHRFLIKSLRGP
jgi:GNAT superfamily N-acetyltransferase